MTMGPGGGSDPGNSGRGGSNSGGGTGGDGPGRGTLGPGGGSDPGNRGDSGTNSGGGTGGGSDGRGNNTPGHPDNPGRRGNSAPTGGGRDGRGTNTPGSPASRARDAMSRRQQQADRRSVMDGGLVTDDHDSQAGLGLEHAMDDQQTENTLNRMGATDTVGMNEVDRLGTARRGGAMLSQTDQQKERGIRHGFNSQTMANRVSDITGVPSAITNAVSSMLGRPKGTMQNHVDIGRQRANQNEMGAVTGKAASLGLNQLGVNVPGNVLNYGYAMTRTAMDKNMNALQPSPQSQPNTPGGGRSEGGIISGAKNTPAPQPAQTRSFEWSPLDMDRYAEGLISLAQRS